MANEKLPNMAVDTEAISNADKGASNKDNGEKTYDDVFNIVRSFGTYQRIMYVGIKALIIPMSAQLTALIFCMGTPEFQCSTANVTCPPRKCCDNCTSYEFRGPFTSTVSEWNLICDRGYIGASLQACFFAGMLIGSIITGIMSDTWGRKICMFFCYAVMFIAALGSCFADCISLFGFLRFVVGFGLSGNMLSSYVYTLEMVGPKRRTTTATLTGCFWMSAGILGVMVSYFIREWRLLLLVFTVPASLFFPCWRLVPESPRWLVLHGRLDEARAVLIKYGGKKGQPVDQDVLTILLKEVREVQQRAERKAKTYTPVDLVHTKKLRRWSLILGYQWFSVAFVGFGAYLYLSQLAGDIYLNYTIMECIGILSIPVDWILLLKFGRRLVYGFYCIIGGTCLLVIQLVHQDYPLVSTGLTIFGTMIGPSWSIIYLITSELYPTVLRNTALGAGSLTARVGETVAPYFTALAQLPGLSMTFPVTVFGVAALVSGFSMYFLPETRFAEMHQTVEQVEAAKDHYGLVCCGKPLKRKADMEAQDQVTVSPAVELTNFHGRNEERSHSS